MIIHCILIGIWEGIFGLAMIGRHDLKFKSRRFQHMSNLLDRRFMKHRNAMRKQLDDLE